MEQNVFEQWMREALQEAVLAREAGELPIGGLLVAGNEIIQRTQTSVVRNGSIVAHGELLALLRAGGSVWTSSRPLTLVTTLEPCLMCLGAAMQCYVDRIVYGMKCAPDGGLALIKDVAAAGQHVPEVIGPVLEQECVEVFASWPQAPSHNGFKYVEMILAPYGRVPLTSV